MFVDDTYLSTLGKPIELAQEIHLRSQKISWKDTRDSKYWEEH